MIRKPGNLPLQYVVQTFWEKVVNGEIRCPGFFGSRIFCVTEVFLGRETPVKSEKYGRSN